MQLEEVLREIGFSEYKAKVYKTLLYLGIATSAVVAKESGVPQTKVHGILNELAKDGFAIIIPGRPTRFKAIPPSSAIVPIIEEKIKKASELKTMVEKAEENLVSKEFPKREILLFQGWNIIRKILEEDTLNSKNEILKFIRFGKPEQKVMEVTRKQIENKVKVKVLGPYRKEREHIMLQHKLIGCEVRVIKNITFPLVTFFIYDNNIINLNFYTPSQHSEGLLVRIEDSDTANLFREFFYGLWKKSEEIK